MRLRTVYDRGFVNGFQHGQRAVADAAAVHATTDAQAATTAGQQWLDDLASHAQRLSHTTGNPVPPEADLQRTPVDQVRAVTKHLPPAQAWQATYRYGFTDGRITGIAVAARDLYLAAGQDLGSLSPTIDGRPAHRWLETTRQRWLNLAARGDAPLPGTPAALARSTLTTGATPTHATGQPAPTVARSAQRAARPAPAAGPRAGQVATTPAPARGVARVAYRPAARG